MSDVTLGSVRSYSPPQIQVREPKGDRWSPARSMRFVVYTSVALWTVIITAVVSLI